MMARDEDGFYTTNAEDQAAVKKLKERIASNGAKSSSICTQQFETVSSVIIANGAYKYVLISAKASEESAKESYFVTSKKGAHYHRNAAEPLIHMLESNGYSNINVLGGGRIMLDEEKKEISIFGYSYGFGRADHEISKNVIEADSRYKDFKVTWSNDGY